jgi:hypothetical protein
LQIASEKAPSGPLAMVIIRNRKTGEGLNYSISETWLPIILSWNNSEPLERFSAAMAAEGLFDAEPTP